MACKGDKSRKSIRLSNWHYNWDGVYFVTLVTFKKVRYFGKVINHKMELSEIGRIAHDIWLELPSRFDYVELGKFVVMPDHFHGILHIKTSCYEPDSNNLDDNDTNMVKEPGGAVASNNPILYNGGVTYEARKINPTFRWLQKYYESNIRTQKNYDRICFYIEQNPIKWHKKHNL